MALDGERLSAFEAVYRATNDDLLRYFLRRTTAPEDAADLVADVYLIAWREKDRMPPTAEARLWLFGIARNLIADHRRRVVRSHGLADALGSALARLAPSATTDPVGSAVGTAAITAALATLSETDREIVQLSAWEGLSPAQIAAVTGRRPGAVRVQLHRARARLRAALDVADEECGVAAAREPRPGVAVS